MACRVKPSRSTASEKPAFLYLPDQACASHRTVGWRSSCSEGLCAVLRAACVPTPSADKTRLAILLTCGDSAGQPRLTHNASALEPVTVSTIESWLDWIITRVFPIRGSTARHHFLFTLAFWTGVRRLWRTGCGDGPTTHCS